MPRVGRELSIRLAINSSPLKARIPAIHVPKAPTPGTTNPEALRQRSKSEEITVSTPREEKALSAERKFPEP